MKKFWMFLWIKFGYFILKVNNQLKISFVEDLHTIKHFILAVNHLSIIDVIAVLGALKWKQFRSLKFITKKSNFNDPLRKFLNFAFVTNIICLDTDSGQKELLAFLNGGKKFSLYIHPEGKISETGQMNKPKLGAAYFAIKSGLPIITVGITGTDRAMLLNSYKLNRHPIKVNFGKVIKVSEIINTDDGAITQEKMNKVNNEMFDQIKRLIGSH